MTKLMLTIEARQVTRRAALVPAWTAAIEYNGEFLLGDLISQIVTLEVDAFKQRQGAAQLLHVLTQAEIEANLEQGKFTHGETELKQNVNKNAAIKAALQAFEDGLYYVFINDTQICALNETVPSVANLNVLFLRLVALAGG